MGASPAPKRPRRLVDTEMTVLHKVARLVATLPPEARLRVLGYVGARVETLPASCEDGGATTRSPPEPPLLQRMRADAAAED